MRLLREQQSVEAALLRLARRRDTLVLVVPGGAGHPGDQSQCDGDQPAHVDDLAVQ